MAEMIMRRLLYPTPRGQSVRNTLRDMIAPASLAEPEWSAHYSAGWLRFTVHGRTGSFPQNRARIPNDHGPSASVIVGFYHA